MSTTLKMRVYRHDYSLSYQDPVETALGNSIRPSLDDARFEAMLLRLHSVIDAEGLWNAIQFITNEVVPNDACALYLSSEGCRPPKVLATASAQNLRQWMEHRRARDSMPAVNPAHAQPKVCQQSDVVFDPRQLYHGELFRRHLAPNGWHHIVRALFWHETRPTSEIVITRTAKQGSFSEVEMALLERLHPHIEVTLQRLIALERRDANPADSDLPRLDRLTAAERELLHLLRTGFSNKEIAARLEKSVRTVKTQLTSVYRKYGVRSRTRLLATMLGTAEQGG